MNRRNPNVLVVEGKDERLTLPELLECCGIPWPEKDTPIHIDERNGIEGVLEEGAIEAHMKASGVNALGLVVDADRDVKGTWDRVRRRLLKAGLTVPSDLPKKGLVIDHQPRVGVWIMPDNYRNGMLETLLLRMAPQNKELAAHVKKSVTGSKKCGAPWKPAHRPKAELMTWLAWQDPPGEPKNRAVKHGMLVPKPRVTGPFLKWVKALFGL